MKDIDWKQVLISLFIGAAVSFLTVFLEGVLDFLRGYENNMAGGAFSAVWYAIRNHIT